MGFRGAIFDVDGVLVDSPHEQAWREGLQQLMENEWSDVRPETSYSPEKFTPEVYQRVMSGKPRYAGAQAALEYFGVPDAERRAQEYGDRKQVMIVELIEASQFHAYPDALRFVLAVKDAGLHHRGGLLIQERQRVPGEDQARRVRRGGGLELRLLAARLHPARHPRRERQRARLRAGQASPRDLS